MNFGWTIMLVLTAVMTISGCDKLNRILSTSQETAENTFTTISYNYTGSEIRQVLFSDAGTRFDVRTAAPGGSPFSRIGSAVPTDNEEQVWMGEAACCFVWNRSENPVEINVLWHVVFDSATYDSAEKSNDERESPSGHPGSVWCQTIVKLQTPYPLHPDALFLHFLPDGAVFAHLSERGTLQSSHALPSSLIKSHHRPSNGPYCPVVVGNPWYKVPRDPHRE